MATNASNVIPVPHLGTLNYITDMANKFDQLLAHLFVADFNQTYLYKGRVVTISSMIEQGGWRRLDTENSLREGMMGYFSPYYPDGFSLDLIVTEIEKSSSRLDFKVRAQLKDGPAQSLETRLIRTVHKTLLEIQRQVTFGN